MMSINRWTSLFTELVSSMQLPNHPEARTKHRVTVQSVMVLFKIMTSMHPKCHDCRVLT